MPPRSLVNQQPVPSSSSLSVSASLSTAPVAGARRNTLKQTPSPSAAACRRTVAQNSAASSATTAPSSRSPSTTSSQGATTAHPSAISASAAAFRARLTENSSPTSSRRSSHGAHSNSSSSHHGSRIPVRSPPNTVTAPSPPDPATSSRVKSSYLTQNGIARSGRAPSASQHESGSAISPSGSASTSTSASTARPANGRKSSYFEMYYPAKGAKPAGSPAAAGAPSSSSSSSTKTASASRHESSRATTGAKASSIPSKTAAITKMPSASSVLHTSSEGSAVRTAKANRRKSGAPYAPTLSNNSSRSSGSISHGSAGGSTNAHSSSGGIPSSSSSTTTMPPASPASSRLSAEPTSSSGRDLMLLAPAPPSPPRSRLPLSARSQAPHEQVADLAPPPTTTTTSTTAAAASPVLLSPNTSSKWVSFEPPANSGWMRVADTTPERWRQQRQQQPHPRSASSSAAAFSNSSNKVPEHALDLSSSSSDSQYSSSRLTSTRTRSFGNSSSRPSPASSPAPLPLPPAPGRNGSSGGGSASTPSTSSRFQKVVKEPVMSIDEIIRAHSAALRPVGLSRPSAGAGAASQASSGMGGKLSPIPHSPALVRSRTPPPPSARMVSQPTTPMPFPFSSSSSSSSSSSLAAGPTRVADLSPAGAASGIPVLAHGAKERIPLGGDRSRSTRLVSPFSSRSGDDAYALMKSAAEEAAAAAGASVGAGAGAGARAGKQSLPFLNTAKAQRHWDRDRDRVGGAGGSSADLPASPLSPGDGSRRTSSRPPSFVLSSPTGVEFLDVDVGVGSVVLERRTSAPTTATSGSNCTSASSSRTASFSGTALPLSVSPAAAAAAAAAMGGGGGGGGGGPPAGYPTLDHLMSTTVSSSSSTSTSISEDLSSVDRPLSIRSDVVGRLRHERSFLTRSGSGSGASGRSVAGSSTMTVAGGLGGGPGSEAHRSSSGADARAAGGGVPGSMHWTNNSSFGSGTSAHTNTSYGGTSTDTLGRSVSPSTISSSFRQGGGGGGGANGGHAGGGGGVRDGRSYTPSSIVAANGGRSYTPNSIAGMSEVGSFVSASSTMGMGGHGKSNGGRRRSLVAHAAGAGSSGRRVPPTSPLEHSRAFSGSSTGTRSTSTSTSAASEAEDQFHDAEEGIGRSMLELELSAPDETVPMRAPPMPGFVGSTATTPVPSSSGRTVGRIADLKRKVSAPCFPSGSAAAAPVVVKNESAAETDEDEEGGLPGSNSEVESISSLDSIDREVRRTVAASRQAHRAKRNAESRRREAEERKEAEDEEVLKYLLGQPSPSLGGAGGGGVSGNSGGREHMLFPPSSSDGRASLSSRKGLSKRTSNQSVLSGGGAGNNNGGSGLGSPGSLSRSGSVLSGTGSSSAPHPPRILQHAASFAGKASPALLKGNNSNSNSNGNGASKGSSGSDTLGMGMWAAPVGSWSTPGTRAASPSNQGSEDTPNASHYGLSSTVLPPVPLGAGSSSSSSKHSQQQQADAAWMSKGNGGGQGKFSRIPVVGMLARMKAGASGSEGLNHSNSNSNATSNGGGPSQQSAAMSVLHRRRAESAASSLSGISARTAAVSLATTSDGEFGGDGYMNVSYATAGYEENGGAGAGAKKNGRGKNGFGRNKSAPPPLDVDGPVMGQPVGTSPTKVVQPAPPVPLTPSNPIAQYIRSERLTRIITLKRHPFHGVKVSLADVGAKNGHPVVIFLGLGAVRYLVGLYDDIASAMGLRLICIDRWGLGKTDTVPEDQRGVLEWGIVVGEVLDQLGIGRFAILAHSAGGPYAMATVLRQPSSRIVGPVHLLAPWVSAQVESNWKWLKYVPDGVIRTAQAAEWKMQAWRLGKQPSLAYEGVGFDARAAANTSVSSTGSGAGGFRKSGEEAYSQGHGQRASKDGTRASLDSISGAYATYSRVLELNNGGGDAISSISEEDVRMSGETGHRSLESISASVSPVPSSFGGASSGGMGGALSIESGVGRSGTAPVSPASLYAESTGSRWAFGGSGGNVNGPPLPSPTLQLPENKAPRKVVKKKSSKLGSLFGVSGTSSSTSSGGSGKQREGNGSTAVPVGKGASAASDARQRTTSLSRLRYNPNPSSEDAAMEHIDEGVPQSGRARRQLRSASVTSLSGSLSGSRRDKDVPALPADAPVRYSVTSLPTSSTTSSLHEVSTGVPDRPAEGMRRSFSATMARPIVPACSNDSSLKSSNPQCGSSSNSLRTLVRMSSATASMRTLDEGDHSSIHTAPTQSTPFFPRMGLGIGLGLPLNTPPATIHEPTNSSLASLPEYATGTPLSSVNTSAAASSRRSTASNQSASASSNQVPDLATALLRASHAESLKGGTADLMAILGRTSRPWGFTYTDVEHPVKVWHGDRDERISLSSAQWMQQEMKDCELIVVKGAGHGLMTNVLVVMEALESIDRHRRD